MKRNKNEPSFINIGLSSLMVVFLVLCLVTFAILSLSSAKSDYSLSEKLATHRTAYYQASDTAEQTLAQIDALLEKNYTGQETYFSDVKVAFDGYQAKDISITPEETDSELLLSYEVPVDEKQTLKVKLKVLDPSVSSQYYEILSWQIESATQWEGDNKINLIPME